MGREQAALGVHKVMSYSDAGSALFLVRWSVPKWMFCLTVRALLRLSRTPGDYFRYCAHQSAVYIGVMGLLIRILGSIFQKALTSAKSNLLSQSQLFSSGKMDPGDR